MNKSKKTDSREIGLEIGAICGKYFLKSQHLHYGYWTGDLEVDIDNLRIAQENYAKFLVSHIPDGVKTILDVGCGTGEIAKKLVDMGYQVDCVSPSPFLTKRAREVLGNTSHIFDCYYEELQTENRYDVILFGESFQYVGLQKALDITIKFLNKGGQLLICDFFQKDVEGKSVMGGGHELTKFYDLIAQCPFELVKDLDITEETSPTTDIYDDALQKAVRPVVGLVFDFLNDRYPVASKFMRWKYKKQMNKINEEYFSAGRISEDFRKFKSYRLFLYKKVDLKKAYQFDFRDSYVGNIPLRFEGKIKMSAFKNLVDSNKRLNYIVRQLRRWRIPALWLAFLIFIVEDILTGKKPYEFLLPDIPIVAIIGAVLILSGGFLRCLARGYFVEGRLFTAGPYALVRHPLFLGTLLIIMGLLFLLNDWVNWVVVLPSFALFYGATVIYEERSLEQRFGKQWQSYKAKVPAIIPSLRSVFSTKGFSGWQWKVFFNTGELMSFSVILILALLIEFLEEGMFK
jgi:protein-S-isoprenylcysteine O-methyltransferase Ste14/ubiquinone/menaquinone biosynthesis C-methylase UbiE